MYVLPQNIYHFSVQTHFKTIYSRPLVSARNLFQDPLQILKSMDAGICKGSGTVPQLLTLGPGCALHRPHWAHSPQAFPSFRMPSRLEWKLLPQTRNGFQSCWRGVLKPGKISPHLRTLPGHERKWLSGMYWRPPEAQAQPLQTVESTDAKSVDTEGTLYNITLYLMNPHRVGFCCQWGRLEIAIYCDIM